MGKIHPIQLHGNWDLGYAMDIHVVNSIPLGEDAYGNSRFDTTRSEIGELIYQFKYRGHYSVLSEIVDTVLAFLDQHPEMKSVDSIIPVPPTKERQYQPTQEIAEEIASRLGTYCCSNVLEKISDIESKTLLTEEKGKLQGTIKKIANARRKHSVLLIDDLYKSGATLRQCVDQLRTDPLVDKVYVITITKTKNI